ncbi:MAG: hypothetical protein WCC03_14310 [Candidatus Acidiferrales bacterium]
MSQTGHSPEHNARKLTTYQKAVLIQVLRTFPNERVEIRYAPDADDALSYAQDFVAVFKAIGWDVTGPEAEGKGIGNRFALAFLVRDAKLPACAEALRDALRIYEIAVETQCGASTPAHTFTLWVGAEHDSRG